MASQGLQREPALRLNVAGTFRPHTQCLLYLYGCVLILSDAGKKGPVCVFGLFVKMGCMCVCLRFRNYNHSNCEELLQVPQQCNSFKLQCL